MADISSITLPDGSTYNLRDNSKVSLNSVAPVENSTTASEAHGLGSIFFLENILCRALSDISIGDTINTGTGGNATPTTIARSFVRSEVVTLAEYNLLSSAEKNADIVYYISDDNAITAADVSVNGASAGLDATNAQAALKELNTEKVPVYGLGKNLLDNWYFVNPVNQRGLSTYTFTSGAYSIDRWKLYRGTITLTVDGLSYQWDGTSGYSPFHQKINNYDAYIGKTVTMSVILGDGNLYSDTFTVPSSGSYSSEQFDQIRFFANASSKSVEIGKVLTTSTIVLVAAKLELGSQQTLAHLEGSTWVLNEIPNYNDELIKCQTSTADSSDTYANKSLATEQQIAYVESGTTASRAYAVGEYFCWNGLLYRVKTAISSGDTFTVGTNCVATVISDVIKYKYGLWTPVNSKVLTTSDADRCYYVVSGHFLVVNVAILLNSTLADNNEISVLSNVASTLGVTPISTAVISAYAVGRQSATVDIPLRLLYANGDIKIRNNSGASISTSKQIYGQIIIGII